MPAGTDCLGASWITLYSRYANGGKVTRCIVPGGTWSYSLYEGQHDTLRVRTEVTAKASCHHPLLADFTSNARGGRNLHYTIVPNGNSFKYEYR